jgi:hypothetical protein
VGGVLSMPPAWARGRAGTGREPPSVDGARRDAVASTAGGWGLDPVLRG